jgi:hypothetical protein
MRHCNEENRNDKRLYGCSQQQWNEENRMYDTQNHGTDSNNGIQGCNTGKQANIVH